MNANIKYLVLICIFSTVQDQVQSFIVMRNNYQGNKICEQEPCDSVTPKKQNLLSPVIVKANYKNSKQCETLKCNTNVLSYIGPAKRSNYYPGYQPGSGYPGQYPGNYPTNYPGQYGEHPGLVGPPGAHPGCPLCDSSVYSYCNHKQTHDSCCCGGGNYFTCRSADCKFLYANSCQEYNLISRCCCVDLQKSATGAVVPTIPVVAPVA